MALSIFHRATGVGLAAGTLLLVGWLLAMADSPERYATYQNFLSHWFGRLLLLGWTWALFYHLCNGIRHLIWDTGRGLELNRAEASGYIVCVASVIFTIGSWWIAYSTMGAIQ